MKYIAFEPRRLSAGNRFTLTADSVSEAYKKITARFQRHNKNYDEGRARAEFQIETAEDLDKEGA